MPCTPDSGTTGQGSTDKATQPHRGAGARRQQNDIGRSLLR